MNKRSPPEMLVCRGLKVFSRPCRSIPTWQRRRANPGHGAAAHVDTQQADVQVTLACANTSQSF